MSEEPQLPDGWIAVPLGVDPGAAHAVATEMLQLAGVDVSGGGEDDFVDALAVAISRVRTTATSAARVWHGLGAGATGAVVDLAVEQRPAGELARYAGGDFPRWDIQRTQPIDRGLATIAVVSPETGDESAFLFRVQVADADAAVPSVAVADLFTNDLAVIAAVWADVVAIASAVRGS